LTASALSASVLRLTVPARPAYLTVKIERHQRQPHDPINRRLPRCILTVVAG
jgi:hypothetical protein